MPRAKRQLRTKTRSEPIGLINYPAALFGFILGILKAPSLALHKPFLQAHYEPLFRSLWMVIPRFLDGLFLTPFISAHAYYRHLGLKKELAHIEEVMEKAHSHELSTLSDYLRVTVTALLGFSLGLLEAIPVGLVAGFNPSLSLSWTQAILFALPRMILGTLQHPFIKANNWTDIERRLLDQEKHIAFVKMTADVNFDCDSTTSALLFCETDVLALDTPALDTHYELPLDWYPSLILNALLGACIGLFLRGPVDAFDKFFLSSHQESLPFKLLSTLGRMRRAYLKAVIEEALEPVEKLREDWDRIAYQYNESLTLNVNEKHRRQKSTPYQAGTHPNLRLYYLRLSLSGILGYFNGFVTTLSDTLRRLTSKRDHNPDKSPFNDPEDLRNSSAPVLGTFAFIKELVLVILLAPLVTAKRWIALKNRQIEQEESAYEDEEDVHGDYSWGIPGYLSFGLGFLIGILRTPLTVFLALVHTKINSKIGTQENSNHDADKVDTSLFATLLWSLQSSLGALFYTSTETADNFVARYLIKKHYGDQPQANPLPQKAIPKIQPHHDLRGLTEYSLVLLSTLNGFLFGLLNAFPEALEQAFNPAASEALWTSTKMALGRFFGTLFTEPFHQASVFYEAERLALDRVKERVLYDLNQKLQDRKDMRAIPAPSAATAPRGLFQYLYLSYYALRGFSLGLLRALPTAITLTFFINEPPRRERAQVLLTKNQHVAGHTFEEAQAEDLLTHVYCASGRFLRTAALCTFNDADQAVKYARTQIDEMNRKSDLLAITALRPSKKSYLALVRDGLVALGHSLYLSPLTALVDFVAGDAREMVTTYPHPERDDCPAANLLFSPLRLLYITFADGSSRVSDSMGGEEEAEPHKKLRINVPKDRHQKLADDSLSPPLDGYESSISEDEGDKPKNKIM